MTAQPVVLYRLSAAVLFLVPAAVIAAVSLTIGVVITALLAVNGLQLGVGLLVSVLVAAVGVAPLLLLARRKFEVTTDGILIRNLVSTHRIPWNEIREVTMARARWPRFGSTAVHLVDGSAVTAAVTDQRTQMFLGRTFWPRPGEYVTWSVATSAAIDAHQRYLRGEFGRRN